MKTQLPPDEYYKSLAKVPTSGGAVIRNTKGEFLIIKQTYKNGWHISGGMTDKNETPSQAVIREVREELGIDIRDPRLFCIDFSTGEPFSRILFVFDCGVLSGEQIKSIKIDNDEIAEYSFVTKEKMLTELAPKIQNRIRKSLPFLDNGGCVYLENGSVIER